MLQKLGKRNIISFPELACLPDHCIKRQVYQMRSNYIWLAFSYQHAANYNINLASEKQL